MLTFPAWSTPGKALICSTVVVINDNVLENMEEFLVYLSSDDISAAVDEEMSETIVYIKEDRLDSEYMK